MFTFINSFCIFFNYISFIQIIVFHSYFIEFRPYHGKCTEQLPEMLHWFSPKIGFPLGFEWCFVLLFNFFLFAFTSLHVQDFFVSSSSKCFRSICPLYENRVVWSDCTVTDRHSNYHKTGRPVSVESNYTTPCRWILLGLSSHVRRGSRLIDSVSTVSLRCFLSGIYKKMLSISLVVMKCN